MNQLQPQDINELKNFIKHVSVTTGEIIRHYFRGNFKMELKADQTPVTIADKLVEEKIREMIMKHYPQHGIIGEEFAPINPDADLCWVLDPIDGTKSFIAGSFDFGTIFALLERGNPILGAIHQPIINELVMGDNKTATCNDQPIHVKPSTHLKDAVLLTTDIINFGEYQNIKGFEHLAKQVKLCRTWGNCFGYALLAQGFADIMIDPIMAVWDIMGLIPIIKGAGGIITDYHGQNPVGAKSIVACTPSLHAEVIQILNK